jgi:hypothetical protein
MGGYQEISPYFSGPIHGGFLWSRQFMNLFCAFSTYGVEYSYVDVNGAGSVVTPITPAGYAIDVNALWSYTYLFDAASGANATLLIASPLSTLQNMDDPTLSHVYMTPLNAPAQMTQIADANAICSGGLFSTPPYIVLFGNDGNVTWSDVNAPQNYTTGDAGSARVTGSKVVKGLPLRTGSSSGGILWSLDSVLRMDFVGGSAIFRFSHISTESSVLSQCGIIEYDGNWYWVGIDRFMVTNGSQVSELPNDMNLNWFFDNLNFTQRQKVFAMSMPRYGEIWWFFPFGQATECTNAIIYNTRMKTWYDTALPRAHGFTPAVYRYPVMADTQPNFHISVVLSVSSGTVSLGDYINGLTSGAGGNVTSISGTGPFTVLMREVNGLTYVIGENFTDITSGAAGTITSFKPLYSVYSHEKGYDAVIGQNINGISAWFETCDFGLPTGGTQPNSPEGQDQYTRITRIEPDFVMTKNMTVQVVKRQFAQKPDEGGELYTFGPTDGKIDMREQGREVRVKFMCTETGGFFEAGKILIHTEPGDIRT